MKSDCKRKKQEKALKVKIGELVAAARGGQDIPRIIPGIYYIYACADSYSCYSEDMKMTFANCMAALAYYSLLLLILFGESLPLIAAVGLLFTMLIIFIRGALSSLDCEA